MVVLAMDITRNHAAESDKLRSRGYRRKPATWNEDAIELGEAEPCLSTKNTRARVKGEDPIGESRSCNPVIWSGRK